MVLNPEKTECSVITVRQKHQRGPLILHLNLDNHTIKQVNKHRLLGVTINNQLCWHDHIDNMCKKISRNLYTLSKIKDITSEFARKIFFL